MKLCMGCMNEYPDSSLSCPKCGRCGVVNTGDSLKTEVVLSGRYIIGRMLGRGENAVSYIARDNILNNTVVVKEFFPKKLCERSNGGNECHIKQSADKNDFLKGVKTFAAKTRLFSNFRDYHNSPVYYDVFRENGTVYYVREYIEGENFSEFCDNKRRSAEERLEVLKQVLFLLNKLHNLGVYSGAVKPGNIIITKNNDAILTDFAIASFSGEDCSYKEDNAFSAPELYRNADLSAVTDVYSVSACAYYALTGIIPQDGFNRTIKDTLQTPVSLNGNIGSDISSVIMSGLDLDPFARCENTETFMKRLFAGDSLDVFTVSPDSVGNKDDTLADQKTMRIFSSDSDMTTGYPNINSGQTEATQPLSAAEIRRAAAEKARMNQKNNKNTHSDKKPAKKADLPKTGKKKLHLTNRGFAVIVAAAAVLLIAGGIFTVSKFIGNDSSVATEDKEVPDLLDKSVEQAKEKIDGLDFDIEFKIVDKQYSDTVKENLIMRQSPEGGTIFEEGMAIEAVVSAGREKIQMKDYSNWNFEDAEKDLIDLGFNVTLIEEETNRENGIVIKQSIEKGTYCVPGDIEITYSVNNNDFDSSQTHYIQEYIGKNLDNYDTVDFTSKYIIKLIEVPIGSTVDGFANEDIEKGVIFDQSPDAGTQLAEGETITLYVSSGVQMAIVPDTQYKSIADAKELLDAAGLGHSIIEAESEVVGKGLVISQDIPYGKEVEAGTTITLTVSKGSSEKSESSEESKKPEESEEEVIKETIPATEAEKVTVVSPPVTEAPTEEPTEEPTKAPTDAPSEESAESSIEETTEDNGIILDVSNLNDCRETLLQICHSSDVYVYEGSISKENRLEEVDVGVYEIINGEYIRINGVDKKIIGKALICNEETLETVNSLIIEKDENGNVSPNKIIIAIAIPEEQN